MTRVIFSQKSLSWSQDASRTAWVVENGFHRTFSSCVGCVRSQSWSEHLTSSLIPWRSA